MRYRAANSSWVSPSARRNVLTRGTRRAFANSSGVIGRASGSAIAAAWTSSSVIASTRAQSVRSGSGRVVPSGRICTSVPSLICLATIVFSLLMSCRLACRYDESPLPDQREPFVLREHVHAGLPRLGELRPRVRSGHHIVGLFRHRGGHLGAKPLSHGLGLIAGHFFERAGEHHGFAGDRGIRARFLGVANAHLHGETLDTLAIVWLAEIIAKALDHGVADLIERVHLLLRLLVAPGELEAGFVEGLPGGVAARQRCRRRLAHMSDAERVDGPLQRNLASRLNSAEQITH